MVCCFEGRRRENEEAKEKKTTKADNTAGGLRRSLGSDGELVYVQNLGF